MSYRSIEKNVRDIISELPVGVDLVAAAKTRTSGEILEAVKAGVKIIGHNYVQEALDTYGNIPDKNVRWHFIGHLQKNKVKKAVQVFDVIETVDSVDIAAEIDKRCRSLNKTMSILIEINSAREPQKYGVFPENARDIVMAIKDMGNIKVCGLMTMGPFSGDPEEARKYFVETKKVFDDLRNEGICGVELIYLSMGMTNSYKVAIEEGANLVRIGTKIFGERDYND